MPIYEYKCEECGETFDVLQKFNSEPVKECKYCGGKVKKLISSSSFQFKGSGWYVTDYKKSKTEKRTSNSSVSSNKEVKEDKKTATKGKQKSVA